ncbi:MAG TPA: BamA/TamA family outer membrane protein [Vicinamibacterales bacterium]|jgi:hypothetical protein|nr:BamA/TamA family outer membrane protein [Vicinamibacterales bacterium]
MVVGSRIVTRAACGAALALALLVSARPVSAQDFGRNKVQYDRFDFRVLQTEHFDLYYYPEEQRAVEQVARMAERWYTRLSAILEHQLSGRQPVILYASHPEFEQTNVVEGLIGEGTGGVTEGGQRRVVLPLAASLRDTDHVLGHELVHAFQYDILGINAESVPLWFIEGMAEYFSLGAKDAQTAMWLRDAAIENELPTIADLYNPRYFPYRFGQGLWAYVGGRWGDAAISRILHGLGGPRSAGAANPVDVIETVTGIKRDVLSQQWHDAIRETYRVTPRPKDEDSKDEPVPEGQRLLGPRGDRGGLQVGPALSPDGSRIAFLSSKNRLAVDLYVADTATGTQAKQLTRSAVDPHFDSLQFLASAGSWAPDNERLAVATVRRGRAVLAIFDTDTGRVVREIPFTSRGEIFNPAWSPDGRRIAFSAQVDGFTNLYLYDFDSNAIEPLTDDAFADLQPSWSPDGRRLAFVTERFTSTIDSLEYGAYQIGLIDVADRRVTRFATSAGGDLTNPTWARDGRALYFVSTATGRPELYRQAIDGSGHDAVRVSDVVTGVAGVTPLSAAVATTGDLVAFSMFRDSGYEIRLEHTPRERPASGDVANLDVLPPVTRASSALAQAREEPRRGLPAAQTFPTRPYAPRMSLVGVGQTIGVGAGGSSAFGTYVSGGISLLFSDVLGNHLVPTAFSVNGGVKDIAAQVGYINRTRRWNWGVFGERVPLLSGTIDDSFGELDGQPVLVETTSLLRQTSTQAGAMLAYPFNRSTRVEFSSSVSRITFGEEIERLIYDANTGQFIGRDTSSREALAPLHLVDVGAAIVRDTSAFGAVGPILGQRLRIEADPTWGDLRLVNVTADLRQYAMPIRPVTFAARLLHVGRYGGSSEDERLWPLFVGYSTLVRGYDPNSFDARDCTPTPDGSCPELIRLTGSRMVVFNGEARVPVGGLFTGGLDYGPVPVELFGFFDAGAAWTRDQQLSLGDVGRWVRSVGAGARVNVFGYLIAEFNAARPLDRKGRGWMYVFNLRPSF